MGLKGQLSVRLVTTVTNSWRKQLLGGRICLGTQPKRFQPEANWVCCSGPVEHMVEAHGAQETDPEKEPEDVRCVRMSQ